LLMVEECCGQRDLGQCLHDQNCGHRHGDQAEFCGAQKPGQDQERDEIQALREEASACREEPCPDRSLGKGGSAGLAHAWVEVVAGLDLRHAVCRPSGRLAGRSCLTLSDFIVA
jgi:hypothetical protein